MKKKLSVPIMVFLVHLFICLFLSFDWSFLEGVYMGFGVTFLIIWGLTFPLITACVSIIIVIIQVKRREKLNIFEIITAVVGCIMILIYFASASGLLKYVALNFVYIFLFVGTLFIWLYWGYQKRQTKKLP